MMLELKGWLTMMILSPKDLLFQSVTCVPVLEPDFCIPWLEPYVLQV